MNYVNNLGKKLKWIISSLALNLKMVGQLGTITLLLALWKILQSYKVFAKTVIGPKQNSKINGEGKISEIYKEYIDLNQRLLEYRLANPVPCIVCHDENVIGAGTYVPEDDKRIAIGIPKDQDMMFTFCVCAVHARKDAETTKLIKQAVLRNVREGNSRRMQ